MATARITVGDPIVLEVIADIIDDEETVDRAVRNAVLLWRIGLSEDETP